MRNLKIATESQNYILEDIPDKYKFIESIAQQYANSKSELEAYYKAGVHAAENLKTNNSEEYFQKNMIWTVRQTIIDERIRLRSDDDCAKN